MFARIVTPFAVFFAVVGSLAVAERTAHCAGADSRIDGTAATA